MFLASFGAETLRERFWVNELPFGWMKVPS